MVTWDSGGRGVPGNSDSRKTLTKDMQISRLLPGLLPGEALTG